MKTSILTLAFAFMALTGISNIAHAAAPGKEVVTILSQPVPISKIEVRGNVELYVSEGAENQVKVYNNYYAESAMVQGQDGTLRIASYSDQKLVVWVTSNSLQKLAVYDNASVKSFGKLSAIELNVDVYNSASAQLDLEAYVIKLKLHDRAKADLSGSVSRADLSCDYSSSLNYAALNAEQLDKKVNFQNPKENLVVAIP
ncbi:MAG: DUF2807 domain-containing protein [Bacteroidetes bacterium]|nr:DUF2807 domain-containing protein [Bacteroidota bacterium]